MDRFLARCPDCARETWLDTETLLLVAPLDPRRSTRAVFLCPVCDGSVSVPISTDVAAVLADSGVPLSCGHPSLGPPAPHPTGPPISYDDLLDFHQLLERPDWFDQLVAGMGRAPQAGRVTGPVGHGSA